ncbi:MAG TPA: hypothetical protein VGG74_31860 [Kofleriaceae bacterium]|jgi:hypothetical protein
MKCLSSAEIARIVTTGDVPSHVAECVDCRRELERQSATRDALRALPVPSAPSEHRRAIKAEAMAAANIAARRSRKLVGSVALVVAIAAGLVAFATTRFQNSPSPISIEIASAESIGARLQIVAYETAPASRKASGAAEPGAVASEPPGLPAALTSFRDAWVALRAGDNRAAVALFDRSTDPAVAEEATYWAAIAAERAGDDADAKRRFSNFIARFPSSPYVEQARRALEAR